MSTLRERKVLFHGALFGAVRATLGAQVEPRGRVFDVRLGPVATSMGSVHARHARRRRAQLCLRVRAVPDGAKELKRRAHDQGVRLGRTLRAADRAHRLRVARGRQRSRLRLASVCGIIFVCLRRSGFAQRNAVWRAAALRGGC